jgi:hypothetical protein
MKTTLMILLLLGMATFGFANASHYAITTGNWNANATWSNSSGGSAGTTTPVAGDIVYIADTTTGSSARTVTIPSGIAAACAELYVGQTGTTGTRPGSLVFTNNTSTLTVTGNVAISKASTNTVTRTINLGAGTMSVGGNVTLSGGDTNTTTSRVSSIQISTGSLTITGNLTFSANAAAQSLITFSGAGTMNIGGSFTATNSFGTLTPGTASTVNFNGAGAQAVPIGVSSITYYNLSFAGAGTKTISANISATNVTGSINVNGGTLANGGFAIVGNAARTFAVANGATFSLTGTSTMPTVFGTRTFGATSTVNYAGGVQSVTALTYGHLTFSATGNKTAAAALTVAGNLTLTAGTFIAGSYTHNIAGNWSGTGAFTNTGSTINFNGTAAQTIGGTATFNLVTINNAVGVTLNVAISATTTTVASGSILDKGAYAITGALTNNGTVKSSVATLASGTVTHNTGSTIDYTAAVAVPAGTTYKNINLTGAGTYTLGGAITIANTFTVSAASTLNKAATVITGALTNNGIVQSSVLAICSGTLTHNTGSTIDYTAAINLAGVAFKNLTLSATGIYEMTGALTVANVLTLSNVGTYLHTANFALSYGSLGGSGSVVVEAPPVIDSPSSASVTNVAAVLGGNVTNINNSNVTERGVYYSTTDGFTIPGTAVKKSQTAGPYGVEVFTVSTDPLSSGTPYYFKAFATNAYGTTYTTQATFTTAPATYTVEITSTPTGADIYVGGVDSNQNTPWTFNQNYNTSATYTVQKAGYTNWSPVSFPVNNILANTSQAFTGTLLTYTVEITSTPSVADIFVDGSDSGQNTPWTFTMDYGSSATYTVLMAGYNFAPAELAVTNISANASQEFTGTLIPDIPAGGSADVGGGVTIETTVDLYDATPPPITDPIFEELPNLTGNTNIILSYTGTGTGTLTFTVGVGTWYAWVFCGLTQYAPTTPIPQPLVVMAGTDNIIFTGINFDAKGDAVVLLSEGADPTLPVELSAFLATATPQNYVMLQWTTQSETNVSGYYIFRNTANSLSTAQRVNNFIIEATNTSGEANYSYTDMEATPGNTYYYWLQNIDMSGEFVFHGPISVTLYNNTNPIVPVIPVITELKSIYPNPFNPIAIIPFELAKAENVTIEVYNIRGEKVRSLMTESKSAGTWRTSWNGKDENGIACTTGMYYVKMTAGKFSDMRKIVLMK